MTGVNHATTGVLVAIAINEPALALPAALLSHFAIDAIPHWDYKVPGGLLYRQAAMMIDLTLTLFLLMVFALTVDASQRLIIAGGILGVAPDLMWLPYFITGKPSKTDGRNVLSYLRRFHFWIQWSETSWGKYVEIGWFVLTVFLIYQVS
jgi:hypothetical protein